MKKQSPQKERGFFKRTKKEIELGLSAKEALEYRMVNNQRKQMEDRFSKKEILMIIDKKKKATKKKAFETEEESDTKYYDSSYSFC